MKEILLEHFHRYPQMQLQDAVKLLYQSEFGGGHMVTSPEKSLKSLEDENLLWCVKVLGEVCTGFT